VTNSYDYPADPINKVDLTGMLSADAAAKWIKNGVKMNGLDGVYRDRNVPKTLRAAPHFIPDRRCEYGNGCKSFDVSLEACALVCLGVAVNAREDGKNFVTPSIGLGPRADLQIAVEGGTNVTPGTGIGAGCSAASGLGYYIEGTLGYDLDIGGGAGGMAHSTVPDWSSGGVLGFGGGCSINSEITLPVGH